MHEDAVRKVLLRALAQAADMAEVQPYTATGTVSAPGIVPVHVPGRVTVDRTTLEALAVLAGFDDLAEAFAAVP